MADNLEALKKKLRFGVRAYLTASGIMHLDEEPAYIAREFAKALTLTDDDAVEEIRESVAHINGCFGGEDNRNADVCTEDEAVESLCWHVLKQPRAYLMKWRSVFGYFFDLFDKDQDGYINLKEFAVYYTSFYSASRKRDDTEFVARAFKAVDQENEGKVSKMQYVNAYTTYYSDPAIPYEDLPLY